MPSRFIYFRIFAAGGFDRKERERKKNEKKRKKEISLQILRPEKFEKQHRFSGHTVARENGDGVGGRTGGRRDRIGR